MDVPSTINVLKALADRSRLRIVNALMEEPRYVEELAQRLGLAASTVSFHLKKLEEAGLVVSSKQQYYTVYALQRELLDKPLAAMVAIEETDRRDQTERMEAYREKVLRTFLRYGKLIKIPVQHKKRMIILEEIAKRFEPGKRYPEREVNLVIADFHDDFCTIRRDMIGAGIMKRERGVYWLGGRGIAGGGAKEDTATQN